ncbi:MAG: 5'-nucleotidase C-terminal domain-containing protein [Alphaproteobacteria bacterium]
MKKLLTATILTSLFSYTAMAEPMGDMSQAKNQLRIFHFNDFHARFEPVGKYNNVCGAKDLSEKGKCFGGAARLAEAIKEGRADAKAKGQDSLVLVGGDAFQGTLYYSFYKGKATADVMNQMGIDAWALGNHEFDDGPSVLAEFADKVNFPLLMANAKIDPESEITGKTKSYIIEQVGEQKVGIIGLITEQTAVTSSPGDRIKFLKSTEILPPIIADLKSQGVEKIILLTHIGFWNDVNVAKNVAGIDLIVGGHSNTLLSNTAKGAASKYPFVATDPEGRKVPIVQAYAYTQYLGDLTVGFDENGEIIAWDGDAKRLSDDISEDAKVKEVVMSYAKPLEEVRQKIVGHTDSFINGDREFCRVVECAMGNLIADAMLERTKEQGAVIAFQNGGGVRASIDAGDITMEEVLTVLPFQNTLATFGVKGSDVRAALENGVSQIEEVEGRFLQVAGLRYSFDPKAEVGQRVKSIEVFENGAWGPLDDAKTYLAVTNDYVRGGGDGFSIFKENAIDPYDYGPNLEDVVIEFLAKNPSYKPELEGRIKVLDNQDTSAAQAAAENTMADKAAEAKKAVQAAAETAQETKSLKDATETPSDYVYVVVKGDSLGKISQKFLGYADRYMEIYEENKGVIKNPDLIYPGQKLKITYDYK